MKRFPFGVSISTESFLDSRFVASVWKVMATADCFLPLAKLKFVVREATRRKRIRRIVR